MASGSGVKHHVSLEDITRPQQMASSCSGALLVSLFMTPLDVVKIRLQSQDMMRNKCFLYWNGITDHLYPRVNGDPPPQALHTAEEICNCKWYNRPRYFNGTLDAFLKISRTEGVSSLWSGLSPTIVLAVPTTVIYMTTYEQLRGAISDYVDRNHPSFEYKHMTSSMVAGAMGRTWAVTVVSPLEMIRTKMQSQKMTMSQIRSGLRTTLEMEGIRGLWKGYSATLYRDVPFSAIYWPCYELFKGLTLSEEHQFGATFVSGAMAGTIAASITLPMDVIKTRRQVELGEKDIMRVKPGTAATTTSIAREIVAESGISGLYAGLVPRVLKVAPACAIMISSYEFCKRFFMQRNREEGRI